MRHMRIFHRARVCSGIGCRRPILDARYKIGEQLAQGTVEYALTTVALIAIIVALALLWRSGQDGALAKLAEKAASHALSGTGPLDIALF
ncbi:hypothetical protein Corgl_0344 [Coriobacterium glomerans PW2]|uniref:Uncharacterized protein n=1 Tax=Coriobacterium glomerans (strain ATCC 49209 / DSM 20642 / JCM 10262 / PW2) TaxID=700015 RepID=F2NA69_CORGP|nr:hypothetical protein [Coriobacterium glomerans]AEB06463.1 hypothetical protein Corgl_0344 [Coriobacterium glomerans PW2]